MLTPTDMSCILETRLPMGRLAKIAALAAELFEHAH